MDNDPPPPYSEVTSYCLSLDAARRLSNIIADSSSNVQQNPIETIVVRLHNQIPALNKLVSELNDTALEIEEKRIHLFKQVCTWRKEFQSWMDQCFDEIVKRITGELNTCKLNVDNRRLKLTELTESVIRASETALHIAIGGRHEEIQEIQEKLQYKERKVRSALSNPIDKSFSQISYNSSAVSLEDCKKLVGNLQMKISRSQTPVSHSNPSVEPEVSNEYDESDDNMAREVNIFTRRTSTGPEFKKLYFSRSFSTKTFKDKARCNALSFTFNCLDQIVVPDKNNKKLKVFTPEGQLMQELIHNKLRSPTDVVVLPSNDMVVSDPECGDAKIFSPSNQLLASLRPCDKPCGLSLVPSASHLIVSCILTNSVHLVDLRIGETSVAKIRYGPDKAPLFSYPHYVSAGPNHSLFVSDRISNCVCQLDIRKISSNGQYPLVNKFGTPGSGFGQFHDPYGCFAMEEGGFLVCDYYNHRIQAAWDSFYNPPLTVDNHIDFPTCAKYTDSGKLYVSEYMTGSIKTWVDVPTLTNDRPPAYDNELDLLASGSFAAAMDDSANHSLLVQSNWESAL
ncbi:DgyrCDS11794 [Dimorphilus gyrociliatus]|uniref:DgyrCDS11794 n=1 Tax=Dimorphilus gyrociliatus TaxID=2664684 RepID=A0A7I8W4I6_9ANNE|nr:DgyrCDS11794 [Dimorphilus gyrociliatus]